MSPPNSIFFTTGMVYNVSAYMDFHPGGEEELMKAAGIDGTDLFDQVNNMLRNGCNTKCTHSTFQTDFVYHAVVNCFADGVCVCLCTRNIASVKFNTKCPAMNYDCVKIYR